MASARHTALLRRRHFCGLAVHALGMLPLARASQVAQRQELLFGIVPQQSATVAARIWIPLLNRISELAGIALRFATAPSIPAFEQRVAQGEYDLAYMNPYHYALFSRQPGYRALAREKAQRLRGIVVVKRDSALRELSQLAGLDLAFPAPMSFAATLLVRAELKHRGIAVKPRFVGSHESVYISVLRGLHEAGGGIPRTLRTSTPEVREGLRVLWSTADYSPHAFAAHPRLAPAVVARVSAALTGVGGDAAGQAALAAVGLGALELADDAHWNDIRALNLSALIGHAGS